MAEADSRLASHPATAQVANQRTRFDRFESAAAIMTGAMMHEYIE